MAKAVAVTVVVVAACYLRLATVSLVASLAISHLNVRIRNREDLDGPWSATSVIKRDTWREIVLQLVVTEELVKLDPLLTSDHAMMTMMAATLAQTTQGHRTWVAFQVLMPGELDQARAKATRLGSSARMQLERTSKRTGTRVRKALLAGSEPRLSEVALVGFCQTY